LEKRAEETSRDDLMELVQRQPEEIAALLRNWLADRRR
jgi:flagellar biosynthesis/type III secretory pathway M-ring protein FliF/YscJ